MQNKISITSLLLLIGFLFTSCSSLSPSQKSQQTTHNNHNTKASASKARSIEGAYDNHRTPASVSVIDTNVINKTTVKSQADYHFTLAEIYSASNQTDKAIEHLNKTLLYDPQSTTVLLKLAYQYIKKGQIIKSMSSVETILDINPKHKKAVIFLGGLYTSMNMHLQAEAHYRQVLNHYPKNHPDQLEISLHLGTCLLQQGNQGNKEKEAKSIFQNIAKHSDKEKHQAYYYLGHISQKEGNIPQAQKHYKKALALQADFHIAMLALVETYEQTNQLKQAVSLLESFSQKFEPNEQIALQLAKLYIYQQDYEKAYAQYEIVLAFRPDDLNFQIRMAFLLMKQKKYNMALNHLQGILKQAPQADRIHFYIGAIYEELKSYRKAIKAFMQVPSTSAYYNEARIYAAYLENKQKQPQKAQKILEEALATTQQVTSKLFLVYASLLNDMKQYDQAISSLATAVKQFPKDENLHFILGSLYDKVDRKEDTIKTMKYILSMNPQHVEALNYLAYTYAEMDRELDQAEKLARQALQLKPNDGYIQDTLGWIMFKKGHFKNSIELLESAHKLNSNESIIAEHLGDAYHKNNLPSKAIEMYKKAYEIETGQQAKEKLQTKIKAIENANVLEASVEKPSNQRIPAGLSVQEPSVNFVQQPSDQ